MVQIHPNYFWYSNDLTEPVQLASHIKEKKKDQLWLKLN